MTKFSTLMKRLTLSLALITLTLIASQRAEAALVVDDDLVFNDTPVGASSTDIFTLSNNAAPNITIESIGLQDNLNFIVSDDGCTGAILGVGATCDIEITFQPTVVGVYQNQIDINTQPNAESLFGHNFDAEGLDAVLADPSVTTAPSVTSIEVGQTVDVAIDLTNNDADDAQNTVLTVTVDGNFTITAENLTAAGCNQVGDSFNCDLGVLAGNAVQNFSITLDTAGLSPSVISVVASVTSSNDADASNNVSVTNVPVTNSTGNIQVEAIVTSANNPAFSGDVATFTPTVTELAGVPAGFVLTTVFTGPFEVTDAGPCVILADNRTVQCAGVLPASGTVDFPIEGNVLEEAPGVINAIYTLYPAFEDTNVFNNTFVSNLAVAPLTGDLEIVKSATPNPSEGTILQVNDTITYEWTVTNNSIHDLTAVEVTDVIIGSVTVNTADFQDAGECNTAVQEGTTIRCTIDALAAGDSITVTYDATVTAAPSFAANIVSVISSQLVESVLVNNMASTYEFFGERQGNLSLTKVANVPGTPLQLNDVINYQVDVTNNSDFSNVVAFVTDTTLGCIDVDITSIAGCDNVIAPNGTTFVCQVNFTAPAEVRNITYSGTVNQADDCFIANIATVEGDIQDTNPADDTASTSNVVGPQVGDLALTLTILPDNGDADHYSDGTSTARLTVANNGAQTVSGAYLYFSPTGTNFIRPLGLDCPSNGDTYTCEVPTLAPGASADILATVQWNEVGAANFEAEVFAPFTDTNPSNNEATLTIEVVERPLSFDLSDGLGANVTGGSGGGGCSLSQLAGQGSSSLVSLIALLPLGFFMALRLKS